MNNRRSCVLILEFGMMNDLGPYRLLFTTFLKSAFLGLQSGLQFASSARLQPICKHPFQLQ